MYKQLLSAVAVTVTLLSSAPVRAQEGIPGGTIHGNFELNAQYYSEDSVINAPKVPEAIGMNAYTNLIYTNGDFMAGVRYEAYLNPMLGFDKEYKGNGIPYRFASFKRGDLQVTVGNFYEQFGNGLIFRSYEEKTLGIDNSIDGLLVKYSPYKGVFIKSLIGNQRYYWDKSSGIVRGADAEFFLNDVFTSWENWKTKIILGGSVVSKYQKDDPTFKYKLPENVCAFAGRMDIIRGRIHVNGEYAYKINDPNVLNNFIYKPGEALFLSASYAKKGLGIVLSAKRIDNMNFRSDRTVTGNPLTLSYLPALTKQHTYSLAAFYPYSTQPNGEIGYYASFEYHFKNGTPLGGKYGTSVSANYSAINSIDKQPIDSETPLNKRGTLGYKTEFLKFGDHIFGDQVYFQDFNVEITHKFNQRWKAIFNYLNLVYNQDVIEGHPGWPMVYSHIAIADVTYKISSNHSVRVELQNLMTRQDKKDWGMALVEYTIAPQWFFSVMDQYNYGNSDVDQRLHYYLASLGLTKGSNRISIAYGRQREGILCVGGVCRAVPASNGFQLSITSTF
jgi:hypothetical protein